VVIHPTELTVKTVLDNEDDYKYAAKNGTANAIRKYQLNYNYEDSWVNCEVVKKLSSRSGTWKQKFIAEKVKLLLMD